jgi:hypothetical protein
MMPRRKQRRKSKPCVICGESTWDWDYVCQSCRNLRDKGALHEEQRAAIGGDRSFYSIEWSVRVTGLKEDRPFEFGSGKGKVFVDLIKRIAQSVEKETYALFTAKRRLAKTGSDSRRGHSIAFTDDQANAVEELIYFCRRLHRTGWLDGYKSGSHFIERLATGDLSMQDLDKHERKKAQSIQGE